MERKSEFPASNPSQPVRNKDFNLNPKLSTDNSASSLPSRRPDDFVSQINAVFKRHKPLGTMQNFSRASRVLVPQAETSKTGNSTSSAADRKVSQAKGNKRVGRPLHDRFDINKDSAAEIRTILTENSSCGPSSINSTVTGTKNENSTLLIDQNKVSLAASSFHKELKKEQFSSSENLDITFQSVDAQKTIDTRLDDISYYLHSLALTEGEEQYNTQQPRSGQDSKQLDIPNIDVAKNARADHMITEKKDEFRHYSTTQSSAIGYSCVTTMSVHSGPSYQSIHAPYSVNNQLDVLVKESDVPRLNQQSFPITDEKKENKVSTSDASNLQPQIPPPPTTTGTVAATTTNASSNVDRKLEKAPRKKKYDPDVFFKVNGKLYQKLGKIGSGGSSEVYKVITSDCTICALKKIKLKGRDYPTAYGFCQEIEYLNKLKGKHNIIQLINHEVTDKSLLQEVMNGSMNVKDKKIKDEQYIYMVLEYGEIDLAHMLSHKWKEADDLSLKIDDNWLRFYWQQMLEAVNTIHEERIVHSDLKPANFLLVRGSLKLIDFGIAKAILSDTTNIQRDAQVGTLNYMAPEAFMWDEEDQNGNTIKCGRPSDIWSLGCILYQMVYGKTPFSEYKTFWAKFKVITDRNHEINYEPVSNPLLIDLMKKCLVWDRNERWRIPQLLQHPFLVPPIPKELPLSLQDTSLETNQLNHLFEKVNKHKNDRDVRRLCSELFRVINDIERENN